LPLVQARRGVYDIGVRAAVVALVDLKFASA